MVLISVDEYARLVKRDRRVVRIEDLSNEEFEMIAQSRVPEEDDHLNEELKDWNP